VLRVLDAAREGVDPSTPRIGEQTTPPSPFKEVVR
jgi:hypothetical protein